MASVDKVYTYNNQTLLTSMSNLSLSVEAYARTKNTLLSALFQGEEMG